MMMKERDVWESDKGTAYHMRFLLCCGANRDVIQSREERVLCGVDWGLHC
jgi:hypothetical protein